MLPGKGVGPLHILATALGARARPPSRRFRRPRPCRFEAFHVFKIFVANPHKGGRVRNVLLGNQPKLLEFMASFQSERADEQFVEEKEFLINEIVFERRVGGRAGGQGGFFVLPFDEPVVRGWGGGDSEPKSSWVTSNMGNDF